MGSSSINHAFGRIIERELSSRGYRVTRKGVASAGLARPDYRDMNEIVERLPISTRTSAVLIYLGMNDGQAIWLRPHERDASRRSFLPWSDARWSAVYRRRVREFLEPICGRGARRAIVLLPVDVKRSRLQRRLDRIRTLLTQAASASSCAVSLSTAGDLDQFALGGQARRRKDGFHMSPRGARLVWHRIRGKALRLVEAWPSTSSWDG